MDFRYEINLDDDDYMEFNLFHQIRSYYGKKMQSVLRRTIWILGIAIGILIVAMGDFTSDSLFYGILFAALMFIFSFLPKPFLTWSVKRAVKKLKKEGKQYYTPYSVMEFSEETFKEETPDERSERRYNTLERISIVEGRYVYLHQNAAGAYIIPYTVFKSEDEYRAFIDFLGTKCKDIDYYPSKS